MCDVTDSSDSDAEFDPGMPRTNGKLPSESETVAIESDSDVEILEPEKPENLLTDESKSLLKKILGDSEFERYQDLEIPYTKLQIPKSIKFSPSMDRFLVWQVHQSNLEEIEEFWSDLLEEFKTLPDNPFRIEVLEEEDLKKRLKQFLVALEAENLQAQEITVDLDTAEDPETLILENFQFFPAKLKEMLDIFEISTNSEKKRMIEMFRKGFDWSFREFQQFLEALEKYGRDLKEYPALIPTKKLDEIEKYSEAFWEKFDQVSSDSNRIARLVSKIVIQENKRFLEKYLETPEKLPELRGYCETKFDRKFDAFLLEKVAELSKSNDDFSFEVVGKELLDKSPIVQNLNYKSILERFQELMVACEEHFEPKIEDPKKRIDVNEATMSREEFLEYYRKPELSPFQFYPKELYKLIDREFKYCCDLKDGKIEKFKVPLSQDERTEIQRLRRQGFPTWTKKEIEKFLKAIEEFGLKNYEKIAEVVRTKSENSVKKYCQVNNILFLILE